MKTTEVNKRIIGRRCKCIFTGLMVTGIIEDVEENEHSVQVKVTCPKIALHSNNYKKCTSYD